MGACTVNGRTLGKASGFTYIELLLVLSVMALLAGIVTSVAARKVRQSKEAALREDLRVLRKAVDDYYADNGRHPERLEDLVEKRYLRSVPKDPFTESEETWRTVPSREEDDHGIQDVFSGFEEKDDEGESYATW